MLKLMSLWTAGLLTIISIAPQAEAQFRRSATAGNAGRSPAPQTVTTTPTQVTNVNVADFSQTQNTLGIGAVGKGTAGGGNTQNINFNNNQGANVGTQAPTTPVQSSRRRK
jgi:hypothetical protein